MQKKYVPYKTILYVEGMYEISLNQIHGTSAIHHE